MKVNIYRIPFSFFNTRNIEFKLWEQGYLELNGKFNPEQCWHLTNWSCWSEEKPSNLHSDIEYSNSDIIFYDSEKKLYHLALPMGWKEFKSLDEIKVFCQEYHIAKS